MSEVLTKVIVNCETGVVAESPLTGEELAQREVDAAASAAQKVLDDASAAALAALKSSARAKLVAGTPLTEEEAATLVL